MLDSESYKIHCILSGAFAIIVIICHHYYYLPSLLFLIYITSNVLIFADDTNVFRRVNTDGAKQHLQNDLDTLVKWSGKWQMLFNFGKCKCLHTGILDINHNMGDSVLDTTVKKRI